MKFFILVAVFFLPLALRAEVVDQVLIDKDSRVLTSADSDDPSWKIVEEFREDEESTRQFNKSEKFNFILFDVIKQAFGKQGYAGFSPVFSLDLNGKAARLTFKVYKKNFKSPEMACFIQGDADYDSSADIVQRTYLSLAGPISFELRPDFSRKLRQCLNYYSQNLTLEQKSLAKSIENHFANENRIYLYKLVSADYAESTKTLTVAFTAFFKDEDKSQVIEKDVCVLTDMVQPISFEEKAAGALDLCRTEKEKEYPSR